MDKFLTDITEKIVHKVMFWEKDNKRKGRILRAFHHYIINLFILLIVISHTFYRSFWLQTFVLIIMMYICVQHLLIRDCVITRVENKLLDDIDFFWAPYIELMGIEPTREVGTIAMITMSTTAFCLLSLEWIANILWGISNLISKIYKTS